MFYDFIISGGGLAGALIANVLQDFGYTVFIFDKAQETREDFRTSAISYASKIFLEEFGIWQKLENVTQIKEIYTYEHNSASFLHFDHSNAEEVMGYVVPNSKLQKVLYSNLKIARGITYKNLYYSDEKVKIILENNQVVEGKFLIAAEGKNSVTLKKLGLKCFNSYYKQSAVICNLRGCENHNNIAREIFISNGIIALLPLYNENEYSLIWTTDFNLSGVIANLSEKEFLSEITKYSGINFSHIITERLSYPLSIHFTLKCYKKNIILIGDTAHAIHPVAGQGFNLTIADIYYLVGLMKYGKIENLNDKLSKFSRERFFDNVKMAFFTDFLVRGFKNNNPVMRIGRNLALDIINHNEKVKNFFVKRAMGFHNISIEN